MNKDISIWTRGVDRAQFNPARRSAEWRRAAGLADDDMAVAFLGRIVMEKGLDVFTDAIRAAMTRGVPLRVVVIGEGPAQPWFAQNLPENAHFTGLLTGADLATALASTDVFFNPSITESFGNVTLEAMACGLPVIAAEASGATNLVQDGRTGSLVTPLDTDGFVDALAAYQQGPALRARHGEAGLAFAKTMDWDEINAAVMRVYARVIERRRVRP